MVILAAANKTKKKIAPIVFLHNNTNFSIVQCYNANDIAEIIACQTKET